MQRLFWIVLLFLAVTMTSKADPVVIAGGTLTYSDQAQSHPFTLTGEGTIINGVNSSLAYQVGGSFPVRVGRQVVGVHPFADNQDGNIVASFPVTVGGVTYNSGYAILLQLNFTGLSFTVPGPNISGFTVTAPFMMSGYVAGYDGPFCCGSHFFSNTLAGAGTQVLSFHYFGRDTLGDVYVADSWTLTFGPVASGVTVQAVPEPISFLLLGTGASALWAYHRSKGKAGTSE